MDEEPIVRRDIKPMLALIIVNWDYTGSQFDELLYPEQDGEVLEKTLETAGYTSVKVVQNISDIESCVRRFKTEHQLHEMERFHFHYSGNIAQSLFNYLNRNMFVRPRSI
jgi:hypothetical protein